MNLEQAAFEVGLHAQILVILDCCDGGATGARPGVSQPPSRMKVGVSPGANLAVGFGVCIQEILSARLV